MVHFFETPDLPLIFVKLRQAISEGLLILLLFHVKLTKSVEQSAILKIVLASAKKSRGK